MKCGQCPVSTRTSIPAAQTATDPKAPAVRKAATLAICLVSNNVSPASSGKKKNRARKPMQQIRACTFDGPGAQPVIRTVPWPKIPNKAALIKVGACGVCGTDLHILKGHWPKPLPWPFTLGHEIGGVLVEVGSEFEEDFMSKPLKVGSKVMIPPLMPCGHCYYCTHYPESANKCLTPVYYGRYL